MSEGRAIWAEGTAQGSVCVWRGEVGGGSMCKGASGEGGQAVSGQGYRLHSNCDRKDLQGLGGDMISFGLPNNPLPERDRAPNCSEEAEAQRTSQHMSGVSYHHWRSWDSNPTLETVLSSAP